MKQNTLQPNFVKTTHPFKIEFKFNREANNLEACLYKNSFLYKPTIASTGASKNSFSKVNITNLDKKHTQSLDSIASVGLAAFLELSIQSLQIQSATIKWALTNANNENPSSIVLNQSKEQTKALLTLGIIRLDSDFSGFNTSKIPSLYIEQSISTNLIVSNMVFNGIPAIFPVPFPMVV